MLGVSFRSPLVSPDDRKTAAGAGVKPKKHRFRPAALNYGIPFLKYPQ